LLLMLNNPDSLVDPQITSNKMLLEVSPVVDNRKETYTDEELWGAFRSGSEQAFISIYKEHFKRLFQYGSQFTIDYTLIEDCIQELFIELRRKRESLGNTDNIKLYLMKCLKRRVIYHQHKQAKHLKKHADAAANTFQIEFSFEHKLIDQQWKQDQIQALNDQVSRLPVRQREVIYYYFFENYTYENIMDLMEFSNIASARNLVYRAVQTLKAALYC